MSPPRRTPQDLNQNVAGMLCYLTIIPAVIFLLIKPYNENRFVRFHAYQSIFFSVVYWVSEFLLNFLTLASAFFSNLFIPVSLAFFVVWVICMIKAYQNKEFKLPILGDLASGQSEKS